MPELLRLFGLRFFFFSNDHTPMHIHVSKGKGEHAVTAKFSIMPVTLVYNHGLSASEIKLAESIIEDNQDLFAERWKEYFKDLGK